MAKKLYPGGFRLTLATAKKLAVQEFGTCKGLKEIDGNEGFYAMEIGKMRIQIHPDMSCSGCIQIDVFMQYGGGHIFQLHNQDTLERNYKEEEVLWRKESRETLEELVRIEGPEVCRKAIDDFLKVRD